MKLHFLPSLCISSFFSSFLTDSLPGSASGIRARDLCPGSACVTFSCFSVRLSLQGHFHGIFDFRDTLTEPSVTKGVKTPVIYSESQLLICKWALPAFPGACPALTRPPIQPLKVTQKLRFPSDCLCWDILTEKRIFVTPLRDLLWRSRRKRPEQNPAPVFFFHLPFACYIMRSIN